MNEKADIVTKLRTACVGHPHAKIAWPHRLLHEAADEIERLRALPPLRAREEIARIIVQKFLGVTEYPTPEWQKSCLDVADAILSRTAGQEWRGPKWQHVKRGSIVTEIARGFAQVAHHPIEEMTAVVIYRHDDDGRWWVRNAVEFDDGRFVPAPPVVEPLLADKRLGAE